MATITTTTYLDDAPRTAGEAFTVNSGNFIIRTDSRVHANAPASMTGSLGNILVNAGEFTIDARNVRWLAYNTGTGNVPVIGTTITQGGVSGYLLGVWSSYTSAPTTAGSAMPATGFIKFREVTGGAYSAGALTGIGASATGADVAGWIEVAADAGANITVPRLGKMTTRGDWFYLDNTTGVLGQTIQIPTNGGGANTYCPGVWVETSAGSNEYEYRPSLNTTNSWLLKHIGNAVGEQDNRQNFVKDLGNGQVQFGETANVSGTFTNEAPQASTYSTLAYNVTYVVKDNIATVSFTTASGLQSGMQVHLDFTTGGVTADGIYTITVIDAYTFTVPITWADTSGNVTVRTGYSITFTSHGNGVDETYYFDFTSGLGVDGQYKVYATTAASVYYISAPHSTTTSGNVNVHRRYTIAATAHGIANSRFRAYLEFTSGSGVNGIYTVYYTDANNLFIIANNNGVNTSGNVTIKTIIGNVPSSGRKIRIPNIFLREANTTTRSTNQINATFANRPELITTSAGLFDLEYLYSTWYMAMIQCYSLIMKHCSTYDSMTVSEIATYFTVEDVSVSMYLSADTRTMAVSSNKNGGIFKDCKFQRGNTPGSTDHSFEILYSSDITLENCTGGIIHNSRDTGKGITVQYCDGVIIRDCRIINSEMTIVGCSNVEVYNQDHCDRYNGWTTSYNTSAIALSAGCSNVLIDGVTTGFNGTIANQQPNLAIISTTGTKNLRLRNVGTLDSPFPCGSNRSNAYNMAYAISSGGYNEGLYIQRVYITDDTRTSFRTTTNTDSTVKIEDCSGGRRNMNPGASSNIINSYTYPEVNSLYRGWRTGNLSQTNQLSVYGSHFLDIFLGDTRGKYGLAMNEPTAETSQYYTVVAGSPKFTSGGSIRMYSVGDQAIWEDCCFRRGHTSFQNTAPIMAGGTITNYTLEYQIDLGSGWNGTRKTLNGTNLSAETIDPAVGFKMKWRITTILANTTEIISIVIWTNSTRLAQQGMNYDLDFSTIELNNLHIGSRIQLYDEDNMQELYNGVSTSSTFTYQVPYVSDISLRVRVMECNGTDATIFEQFTETLDKNGISRTVNQVTDDIYVTNNIDGSTVTGITINDALMLIETDTGSLSWQEIYAYETYWLSTEEGIRDEGRFIEAIDTANYKLFAFKIKNISSPTAPLVISGGYGFDAVTGHAIDLLDTTGGTIFTSPDRVVAYGTTTNVVTGDVADVWTQPTRTLTTEVATKKDVYSASML